MTNPNKKNTQAKVNTVEIPEAELANLVSCLGKLFSMHNNLIGYYEEESTLKKHHRAYLHVRDKAEQVIKNDIAEMSNMLTSIGRFLDSGNSPLIDECGHHVCKVTEIPKDEPEVDFIDDDFEDDFDDDFEDDFEGKPEVGDDKVVMSRRCLEQIQTDMIDLIDTVDDLTELYEAMLTVINKLTKFGNPDSFALITEAKITADHIFERLDNSELKKIG